MAVVNSIHRIKLLQKIVAWVMRLWVALLLFFGSEIVLWANPSSRELQDWVLIAIAYLALSTLLLDVIQRYRIRNLSGLLFVSGLYALLASLIINPETTLIDVPRTIATRVLGAHTFVAWMMLSFMLILSDGPRRKSGVAVPILSAIAGFGWGVWVRYFPLEADTTRAVVSLETMLGRGVPVIFAILVLFIILFRNTKHISADDLRLVPMLRFGVVIIMVGVFVLRFDSTFYPDAAFGIVTSLIVFAGLVVWFQAQTQRRTLLDRRIPIRPLFPPLIVLSMTSFTGLGAVGYGLPREVIGVDLLAVLTGMFTIFGIVWLPLVSVILGIQAFQQQVRSEDI
ncbi:MAG: hypothetical protein D6737_04525 [Chloroflexi bacterium]|nr:MAG: hypothetical protein D6737_04525 [Chloroflexota bacterium]